MRKECDCGNEFECTGDLKCWCNTMPKFGKLNPTCDKCMCPECLAEAQPQ